MDSCLEDLHRRPSSSEVVEEMGAIGRIGIPTALTGLAALSIGFANITGYSVLSGLAMGMEPICGQAFGARQSKLLGRTLHRTVLLLFTASLPISVLWLNIRRILVFLGQDESISAVASTFATAAIPDLFFLSFSTPSAYLRSQNINLPVTACSAASVALHIPLNYLLVVRLRIGVAGVASPWLDQPQRCLPPPLRPRPSGPHRSAWVAPGLDALRGWVKLLRLAIPTCASVCLEWWWYELMILLCGLLPNPRAAVASMGYSSKLPPSCTSFPPRARPRGVHPCRKRLGARHQASTACRGGVDGDRGGAGVGAMGFTTARGVAFGFAAGFGFVGLWVGLLAAQASCAIIMGSVLARTDWVAEMERTEELTVGETVPPPLQSSTLLCSTDDESLNQTVGITIVACDDGKTASMETDPLIPFD
ncbi:hypothetical protein HPP92_007615 [Vanilla planifolia]|uniref:Protein DETOXIFICATION n=1 Tax=Vanilla planifolia TaxID=51239 RepID=A0A835RRI8_VANPL|nr:hypothetical protein HPP92_007615 [Vanilla planifolia]